MLADTTRKLGRTLLIVCCTYPLTAWTATDESRLDRTERRLSGTLTSTARWFDAFFDSANHVEEDADMRLRLRQRAMFARKEDSEYKTSISARVRLPNLTRKLSLVFSGNDEPADFEDDGEEAFSEGIDETIDDPSIGARYQFSETSRRFNAHVTSGHL